ncbi:polysaccharide biosynthesis C-terminal domain-containing protein [Anabaena sp. UHCC 0451]|uniref:polysaccharide biosynthesis C-terminal domain-containing protein n=1 Tax=Anabaena sp. UHCC 0451 TaxID=2055235 RepID=UPI002B1F755B|nr:polysaccharide biosynthesis C-terminal domain-containing protein [Anabaena sp. UHCC 0451]MEA5575979.1 polysaccharide biosynthesis C-terminal domain-containing protein [Anabaena sp. UHCC 0451]
MQRTGRSVVNFATGLMLQVMTLGIGIISTPLLLSWLGDERYGAFRAASDWGSYLNLLELGISGSLMALLAKAVGIGERQQIRLTLATGIRAYLKIMIVMVLAGVVLGVFITRLVPVEGVLVSELQKGYWLGFFAIFLLPLSPFRLLADASQRSYFANVFIMFQSLLITGLGLLLARGGFGITGQYIAALAGNIGFQILMCWEGLRRYPDVFSAVKDYKAQASIEKKLWQLNWSTFTLNLSGRLGLFTDNIIISYSLSPATVVPFFVTQRLAALAQGQIQGIGNATWAALADLYAKGEIEKFNARLLELTRLVAVMGVTFMVSIAAYNHHFIRLWVGEDRFGGDGLTLLAASNGFLLGLLSLWGWCFSGTGQQPKLVRPTTISAGINFLASILCTHFFGIIGPLLGTFIAFTSVSLWQLPLLMREVFGTSLKQLFLAVVQPLAVGIPYGLAVWWIAKNHIPWGWLGLTAEMGISAFIYLAVAWFFVLNQSERQQWNDRLNMLLSRFQR